MLFPVGGSHAVGAHQGFAVHQQADHDELAVFKTQAVVAGAGEGEVGIGPVLYGQNFLCVEGCHIVFLNEVNPHGGGKICEL